jgi:hypothetical protein
MRSTLSFLFMWTLFIHFQNLTCSREDALKKIDKATKNQYCDMDTVKEIIDLDSIYVVRYYPKRINVLGGDLDAIVRKKDCKIISLKRGQ